MNSITTDTAYIECDDAARAEQIRAALDEAGVGDVVFELSGKPLAIAFFLAVAAIVAVALGVL